MAADYLVNFLISLRWMTSPAMFQKCGFFCARLSMFAAKGPSKLFGNGEGSQSLAISRYLDEAVR
jgi:hypothetical protein